MTAIPSGPDTVRGNAKWTPVDSEPLAAIIWWEDYRSGKNILGVRFKASGRVYHYFGVPSAIYLALMHAPSKGKYYNKFIKNRYAWVRA